MKKYFFALLILITVSCAKQSVDPDVDSPINSLQGKWWDLDSTTWIYEFQPKLGKMYINDVGTDREGDIVVTDSTLWMDYSGMRRKYTYTCVGDTLKITTTPPLAKHTSVYKRFKY